MRQPQDASADPADLSPLSLADLPTWSPWPARLLGLKPFEPRVRDIEKIEAEYNQDKWLQCLRAYRDSSGTLTSHDLRLFRYGVNPSGLRAAVVQGALVLVSTRRLLEEFDRILFDAMAASIARSATVVELGSSFGPILGDLAVRFPGPQYLGGEYSDNAVTLAGELFAGRSDIAVSRFNFHDDAYELLEGAPGPVTLFTCQAIEQVRSARHIIDVLSRYRDKIISVFHLEPSYEFYDDSLLGLMRRRYIELNDYNRDLFSVLQGREDVRILRLEREVVGWNPFNALTLVHWTFRRA
jgi:hypothetical protein